MSQKSTTILAWWSRKKEGTNHFGSPELNHPKFHSINHYEIIIISLPAVAKKTLKQAIEYMLIDYYPDESNSLYFEFRELLNSCKRKEIAVIVYHTAEDIPSPGLIISGLLAIQTAREAIGSLPNRNKIWVVCNQENFIVEFDGIIPIKVTACIHDEQIMHESIYVVQAISSRKNLRFAKARFHTISRKVHNTYEKIRHIIKCLILLTFGIVCASVVRSINISLRPVIASETIEYNRLIHIEQKIRADLNEITNNNRYQKQAGLFDIFSYLTSFIQNDSHISEIIADKNSFRLGINGKTSGSTHAQLFESSPILYDVRLSNLLIRDDGSELYTIEGKYRAFSFIPTSRSHDHN